MTEYKPLLAFLLAMFFTGCSNVKNQPISGSNHQAIIVDISKSSLSDADKKAAIDVLARADAGSYSANGKTVGQAIEDQQIWQAKQDAEIAAAHEAQLKAESQARELKAAMLGALSVQPIQAQFQKADIDNGEFQDKEHIITQWHNIGRKAINDAKGLLTINDKFGDKIISVQTEFISDHGQQIGVGQAWTQSQVWDVNSFDEEWKRFENTSLSDTKSVFTPYQINFSDGSVLKAANSD